MVETSSKKKKELDEKKAVQEVENMKEKEWTFEEWMNCTPDEDPFPVSPRPETFTPEELERHYRREAYAMEVAKF